MPHHSVQHAMLTHQMATLRQEPDVRHRTSACCNLRMQMKHQMKLPSSTNVSDWQLHLQSQATTVRSMHGCGTSRAEIGLSVWIRYEANPSRGGCYNISGIYTCMREQQVRAGRASSGGGVNLQRWLCSVAQPHERTLQFSESASYMLRRCAGRICPRARTAHGSSRSSGQALQHTCAALSPSPQTERSLLEQLQNRITFGCPGS